MNVILEQLLDEINSSTEEELSHVDENLLKSLLQKMGEKFISKNIFKDGLELRSHYKDMEFLAELDSGKFLKDRNQLLLSFINGCCNLEYEMQSKSIMSFSIAVTLEMIYFIRNLNLVLPHCFLLNLMQSFVSGSKTVSALNGKISPSGGYTTYKKWLDKKGSEALECPEGDVITFFDNVGKYVNRTYRVATEKIKPADIITATLHFIIDSDIQKREDLMPGKWRLLPEEEKQIRIKKEIEQSNNLFREIHLTYIDMLLNIVKFETNDVEKAIANQKTDRQCINCGKIFHDQKRKCDLCSGKVSVIEADKEKFSTPDKWPLTKTLNIGQSPTVNKKPMVMGEPILVNPNSYVTVKKVLDAYKINHKIPHDRKWVILGCDGVPYRIASRIVAENPDEYDWLALLPGLGHIHMNQLKTFFKVADEILLEPLGKEVLNFCSPKAYQYLVAAKDTHKSFQTLQILLHGTAMELCSEYVKWAAHESVEISAIHFITWMGQNENETVALVHQLIFNFALAILVQKIGIRANDINVVNAGRYKFSPMFYGFNHPIYQELEYVDICNVVSYPEEVRSVIDKNMAFNRSDLDHNNQGGDFCLENKIKRHKMVAPKGFVSNQTWKRVSRSIDKIEAICTNTNANLNVTDEDSYREVNIYNEIVNWRALLRVSELCKNRLPDGIVKNIYGEPLNQELQHLTEVLNEKKDLFYQMVLEGKPITKNMYGYVSIKEALDINFDDDSDLSDED